MTGADVKPLSAVLRRHAFRTLYREFRREGMSTSEIAATLGMPEHMVDGDLAALDDPPDYQPDEDPPDDWIGHAHGCES